MSTTVLVRPFGRLYAAAILCLSGAGLGIFLLYQDLKVTGGQGYGNAIGILESVVAEVRRKPSGTSLWTRAFSGESLYKRDLIRVGAGGHAVVRLNQGTVLEIEEDSLVLVEHLDDLKLNLKHGAFLVRDDVSIQRVEVVRGGKLKVETIPVRVLLPAPHAHFFVQPAELAKIQVSWEKPAETQKVFFLEVSTTPSFEANKTRRTALAAGEAHRSIVLPEGNYYWRLSDAKHSRLSETRDFAIHVALPLTPLSPSEGQRLVRGGDTSAVVFQWQQPSAGENYGSHFLELASDAKFENILRKENIAKEGGLSRQEELVAGKYFWRLRSEFGSTVIFSPIRSFELSTSMDLDLILSSPKEDAVLNLEKDVNLAWVWEGSDATFRVVIEKRETEGLRKIAEVSTAASTYNWKDPQAGEYQWRVQAYLEGKPVGSELTSRFTLVELTPLKLKSPLHTEIFFWEKKPEITFSWDAAKSEHYRLEIASDQQFHNMAFAKESTTPMLVLTPRALPDGHYFWRVVLLDENGTSRSVSDASEFTYGVFPRLSAPERATPNTGTTMDFRNKDQEPVLKWAPVPDASHYEVSLRNASRAFTETVKTTGFSLKGMNGGLYQWTVRAIDPLGRKGEALAWREFRLEKESLRAPKKVILEVR